MKREKAIVIGGSMAGLMAARVLSGHFEQVVLIERDSFPQAAENRRGVPQGRHTHGLLASGLKVLEQLFPGFASDAVREGANAGDLVRDFRWYFENGCLARQESDLAGLAASRPFIEDQVRRRVLAIPNVIVKQGTAVEALLTTTDQSCVTGVRLGGEECTADLVIDASGRGSRTPQWLEAMGYQKPVEERVEVALGYTTRFFRRKTADLNGDLGTIIAPAADTKRGGVMIAQEGGRWTVTLMAYFGNYAPENLEGFIEFSRTLPAPYIHEVIREAEPIGDAFSSRFPASLRRRYEKLERFPQGYLVMGDGISSFNPIYGQGMSVAALECLELDAVLKQNSVDLSSDYFRRISKVVDIPWSTAVGNDLRIPETVGPRSTSVNIINWYIAKLHSAAHSDGKISTAFHKVSNLLAPPPSILAPRIAWRVLRQHLLGKTCVVDQRKFAERTA